MNIIILGAPYSGKSTASKIIKELYPAIQIFSMSQELKKLNDPEVQKKITAGDIVDIDYVKNAFSSIPQKGTILIDGMPRSLEQLSLLSEIKDLKIIYLDVDNQELLRRGNLRKKCLECEASLLETTTDGKCPKCNGEVVKRDDDKDPAHRLEVFTKETLPVVQKLKEQMPQAFYSFTGDYSSASEIEELFEKITHGA